MKLLRFAVIALFLALVGFVAFASPAAHRAPLAAATASGVILWMGMLFLTPLDAGYACAISVPAALKLDTILGTAVKALQRRLLPLMAFSTVYRDFVLQGTDIVQVPFVPLQQTASKDFDYDVGYESDDGSILAKPITVNKRKYQSLEITSRDLARQPILELEEIMVGKANQLAEDIINDIFGNITLANFGAAIYTGLASTIDSDIVTNNIRKALVNAMWPETGRSLIVNPDVDANLLSDTSFKNAFAFGDRDPIGEGKIRRCLGLDYFDAPILPTNGENLIAIAALKYGILTAFSPIEPSEAVKSVMVGYAQATHEMTGLTLEYRNFATAYGDKELHIIECNYGSGLGDAAQIKRIVSA